MSSKRVSIYLSTANYNKLADRFGADMNLSQALNQVVAEWQPNGVHAVLKTACPHCGAKLIAVIETGHVFCNGFLQRQGMACDYETTLTLTIEQE